MPIRLRLTLVYLAAAVLLVAAGGLLLTRQLHTGLVASVDTGLRTRADQLAQAVERAGDNLDFQDQASRLIAPKESFAQVIAPDGRVAESSEAVGTTALLAPGDRPPAGQGPRFVTRRLDDEPVRLLVVPVARPDGTWVVVVGSSLGPTEQAQEQVRRGLVAGGIALVLLAGVGSWLLAGAALRPVERLRREVDEISDLDPAASLEVPPTRDELAALAATMNRLLARLQAALARERRLVADASHELRTPLAALRAELELALRPGRPHDQVLGAVADAIQDTDRLGRLAEDLLLLARSDEGAAIVHPERQSVRRVLASAVEAAMARAGGTLLHLDAPADLVATVDADRLRQAVDNLLKNALRVAPPATVVRVHARLDDGLLLIDVADAGPGFPEDFLPHAFERFRRSDLARDRRHGGAGLGLAIVKAIARAHGGWARAWNDPAGGARVQLAIRQRGPA